MTTRTMTTMTVIEEEEEGVVRERATGGGFEIQASDPVQAPTYANLSSSISSLRALTISLRFASSSSVNFDFFLPVE